MCNFENSTPDEKCHVHLLDLYISKLPEKNTLKVKPQNEALPWFCDVPVGKNTLQNKLKRMCANAGIKMNHSLRSTGASELYANVPEKLIQERTGHRSVTALRTYERTAHNQHQAVSSVLSSSAPGCSYQSSSVAYSQQSNIEVNCHSIPTQASTSVQLNFQSLNGCTINVYQHPPTPAAGQTSPVTFKPN